MLLEAPANAYLIALAFEYVNLRKRHSGLFLQFNATYAAESSLAIYFASTSLILSPPFATGMTQIGVATSAELRSDV